MVSVAGRFKGGGGAPGGSGASTQDMEAHLEKLEAELERKVHERDAAAARHKEF